MRKVLPSWPVLLSGARNGARTRGDTQRSSAARRTFQHAADGGAPHRLRLNSRPCEGRMVRPTRLEVTDLSLARGPRTLFRDLSFDLVKAGQAVALMGENGAGKTSLLRERSPGSPQKTGEGAHPLPWRGRRSRRRSEAVAHTKPGSSHRPSRMALQGSRSARAELELRGGMDGRIAAMAALREQPRSVGAVADSGSAEVRKLSAGQRRRLALIRLVAAPRALWLLDEPTDRARCRQAGRGRRDCHARRIWLTGGLIVAAAHDALPIDPRKVVRVGRCERSAGRPRFGGKWISPGPAAAPFLGIGFFAAVTIMLPLGLGLVPGHSRCRSRPALRGSRWSFRACCRSIGCSTVTSRAAPWICCRPSGPSLEFVACRQMWRRSG